MFRYIFACEFEVSRFLDCFYLNLGFFFGLEYFELEFRILFVIRLVNRCLLNNFLVFIWLGDIYIDEIVLIFKVFGGRDRYRKFIVI